MVAVCHHLEGSLDIYMVMLYNYLSGRSVQAELDHIGASQGFDGVLEAGEASRCDPLITKLKLNANDNLAYAA